MESSKPAQNIQDSFLNTARKEKIEHHHLLAQWGEVDGPDSFLRQIFRGP